MKAFMADGRYGGVCKGSLLGIKGYNRKKGHGVPTGSERILYMKSMDFEEFLWAKGVGADVIAYLGDCLRSRTPVSEATHKAMLRHFREYICVGGLPAVVERFLTTSDMNAVLQEQRDLIDGYDPVFGARPQMRCGRGLHRIRPRQCGPALGVRPGHRPPRRDQPKVDWGLIAIRCSRAT